MFYLWCLVNWEVDFINKEMDFKNVTFFLGMTSPACWTDTIGWRKLLNISRLFVSWNVSIWYLNSVFRSSTENQQKEVNLVKECICSNRSGKNKLLKSMHFQYGIPLLHSEVQFQMVSEQITRKNETAQIESKFPISQSQSRITGTLLGTGLWCTLAEVL